MVKPLKRVHVKQYAGDTLEVLQGEVARLDQRFKVCAYLSHHLLKVLKFLTNHIFA